MLAVKVVWLVWLLMVMLGCVHGGEQGGGEDALVEGEFMKDVSVLDEANLDMKTLRGLFLRLSLKYHPDRNKHARAHGWFAKIQEKYTDYHELLGGDDAEDYAGDDDDDEQGTHTHTDKNTFEVSYVDGMRFDSEQVMRAVRVIVPHREVVMDLNIPGSTSVDQLFTWVLKSFCKHSHTGTRGALQGDEDGGQCKKHKYALVWKHRALQHSHRKLYDVLSFGVNEEKGVRDFAGHVFYFVLLNQPGRIMVETLDEQPCASLPTLGYQVMTTPPCEQFRVLTVKQVKQLIARDLHCAQVDAHKDTWKRIVLAWKGTQGMKVLNDNKLKLNEDFFSQSGTWRAFETFTLHMCSDASDASTTGPLQLSMEGQVTCARLAKLDTPQQRKSAEMCHCIDSYEEQLKQERSRLEHAETRSKCLLCKQAFTLQQVRNTHDNDPDCVHEMTCLKHQLHRDCKLSHMFFNGLNDYKCPECLECHAFDFDHSAALRLQDAHNNLEWALITTTIDHLRAQLFEQQQQQQQQHEQDTEEYNWTRVSRSVKDAMHGIIACHLKPWLHQQMQQVQEKQWARIQNDLQWRQRDKHLRLQLQRKAKQDLQRQKLRRIEMYAQTQPQPQPQGRLLTAPMAATGGHNTVPSPSASPSAASSTSEPIARWGPGCDMVSAANFQRAFFQFDPNALEEATEEEVLWLEKVRTQHKQGI